MTYAKEYALALHTLYAEGKNLSELLERLDVLLSKRGHTKLKTHILHALLRLCKQKQNISIPKLEIAEEKHLYLLRQSIDTALKQLNTKDSPKTIVDPTLIGGYILTYQGKKIDLSYKTKLHTLYQNIINT